MNKSQAFKLGFLSRCVEEGLTVEQTRALVKVGVEKVALVKEIVSGLSNLGQTALGMGVPIALAAPPILGGVAGYAAGKLSDVDDTDAAEIKKQELISEYKRQAERLRRQRAIRDYKKQVKSTGRIFL